MPNNQVKKEVEEGHRMSAPEGCPPEMYQLMQGCWSDSDYDRPTFADIVHMFLSS